MRSPDPATRSLTVLETRTSLGRVSGHARTYMHGNPTEVFAHQLTFAGVNSCTDLDVQALGRIDNGPAATDCPSWTIETGEEAVPHRIDFAAAMALDLLAHEEVVMAEKLLPGTVSDLGCSFG
jgi:hypothetical protein